MITYKKQILQNGLTVIVNRDRTSKLAAVNLIYRVGARNEDPSRTGFAHLFEHLMFRGTAAVPDFDTPVQLACGENNAFTNNDYTDFYITLPVDNIETALWLESDRMTGLQITPEALETEKQVVIEEYKQRYLNRPYGDMTALVRDLAYKVHPYRWTTIGLTPDHVAAATLDEVKAFHATFYHPSNAILSISADLEEERMIALAAKWFGAIADRPRTPQSIPQEPCQQAPRRMEVDREVPATTVTIAFPMAGRQTRDFHLGDLTTDLLAGGDSSRLYDRLVRERHLFSSVNAYVTGDLDPGLYVLTGRLLPETPEEEAEAALLAEARGLVGTVTDFELEKVKNKFEANCLFGELNVMNKALNLGFYELAGDVEQVNAEPAVYRSITHEEVDGFCLRTFDPNHSNTLVYRALPQVRSCLNL